MLALYGKEVTTNLPEFQGIKYQDCKNTGRSQSDNLVLVSFSVSLVCFVVIIMDAEVVTYVVKQALYITQFTLHIA